MDEWSVIRILANVIVVHVYCAPGIVFFIYGYIRVTLGLD